MTAAVNIMKDLAAFAAAVEDATKSALPNRGRSRYASVRVCLIRWECDTTEEALSFEAEATSLSNVLANGYGFKVETWTIPTEKSHRKLMGMALDFIDEFDTRDNLFIVYYVGHGTINDNRQSVWNYTRNPKSPSVDWSSIQSPFENSSSDTLCLLDCCAAGSSANNVGSGTLETIGACGLNRTAPQPGKYSFTTTLVEVLDDWKAKPYFSASLLHSEVLCRLKRKRPEKGREGVRMEWCTTPAYFIASSDPRPQSVELCRLIEQDLKIPKCSLPCSSGNTSLQIAEVSPQSKMSHELTSTYPNGDLTQPHVLLSVAFEEDQDDVNPDRFQRWVSRIPAFVKHIGIEEIYKSYSTLITVSIPVVIWNMLPEDPACCFIGYVTFKNLASNGALLERSDLRESIDSRFSDLTDSLLRSAEFVPSSMCWAESRAPNDNPTPNPLAEFGSHIPALAEIEGRILRSIEIYREAQSQEISTSDENSGFLGEDGQDTSAENGEAWSSREISPLTHLPGSSCMICEERARDLPILFENL